MSRRAPFREADVSRALKAVQGAGLSVARVEIDQDGKIVIVSGRPLGDDRDGLDDPQDALTALRNRNAQRRAQRAASRQANPR